MKAAGIWVQCVKAFIVTVKTRNRYRPAAPVARVNFFLRLESVAVYGAIWNYSRAVREGEAFYIFGPLRETRTSRWLYI